MKQRETEEIQRKQLQTVEDAKKKAENEAKKVEFQKQMQDEMEEAAAETKRRQEEAMLQKRKAQALARAAAEVMIETFRFFCHDEL